MLIFTVGVSGSGKSTFCQDFLRKNPGYTYLSSDFCRGILGNSENDQSVSAETFKFLETAVHYFLKQGGGVIVDATFTHKKSRKNIIKIARFLRKEIVCYYFDIPIEICWERNKKRKRVVPEDVIERQKTDLVIPAGDEVDYLLIVNSDGKIVETRNFTK